MCTIVCLLFVYVSSYVANSACSYMQISSVISALMARARACMICTDNYVWERVASSPGSLGTRLSANSTRSRLELELDSTRRLVIPLWYLNRKPKVCNLGCQMFVQQDITPVYMHEHALIIHPTSSTWKLMLSWLNCSYLSILLGAHVFITIIYYITTNDVRVDVMVDHWWIFQVQVSKAFSCT